MNVSDASNVIEPNKVKIEIPNLDSYGYGPNSNLTRKQWQNECLEHFLAGADAFTSWQQRVLQLKASHIDPLLFDIRIVNTENPSKSIEYGWQKPSSFVIDLTNQEFLSINMKGYVFFVGVLFSGSVFKGFTECSNTKFHEPANFTATTFENGVFISAEFLSGAIFEDTIFNNAFFTHTSFELAIFRRAKFFNFATFHGSKIKIGAFECSTFHGLADFSGNTITNNNSLQRFGQISFAGAVFNKEVNFSNRIFDGLTDFGKDEYKSTEFNIVPLFHNCVLHQDTTFEDAIFPEPRREDETDARAYNTLRLAMNKNQHLLAEKKFTRYVLESERVLTKGSEYFFFTVYKVISNYGYSILKPFFYLLIFPILLAGIGYSLIESKEICFIKMNHCTFDKTLFLNGMKFSFLQEVPLGLDKTSEIFMRDYFPNSKSSFRLLILLLFQKTIALIGWFLIGLAIRNLFRIK